MGLSPSPTFANVYTDHGMHFSAHSDHEKVSGSLVVYEVIQNGCESGD